MCATESERKRTRIVAKTKLKNFQMTEVFKKKTQKETLEERADEVIEMIAAGMSYKQICEKMGVSFYAIDKFVNDSEYSAQARQALKFASYELLDKAQEAIESIQDDSTNARVARQREMKNILMYRAMIKNRKELDLNYREDRQETNNQIVVVKSLDALRLEQSRKQELGESIKEIEA